MSIEKLEEFAKDGDKNLDNLDVSQGFLQSEKPERQWFNQLLNNLTRKTNEVIDYTDGVVDDVAAQKLDTGITATAKFGGVDRELAKKLSETVSIEDFYITSWHQALIDALSSTADVIIIPDGKTYNFTSGISVSCSGKTIKGSGTLTVSNTISEFELIRLTGDNNTIQDISVSGANLLTNAVRLVGNNVRANGMTITNLYADQGSAIGIYIISDGYYEANNNVIKTMFAIGNATTGDGNGMSRGIAISRSNGIATARGFILNNYIEDCFGEEGDAITVNSSNQGQGNTLIANNTIKGWSRRAIKIQAFGVDTVNNHCENVLDENKTYNLNSTIILLEGGDCEVKSNYISDFGTEDLSSIRCAFTRTDTETQAKYKNIIISDNVIRKNRLYDVSACIYFTATAMANLTVTRNDIDGQRGELLKFSGITGLSVLNNTFKAGYSLTDAFASFNGNFGTLVISGNIYTLAVRASVFVFSGMSTTNLTVTNNFVANNTPLLHIPTENTLNIIHGNIVQKLHVSSFGRVNTMTGNNSVGTSEGFASSMLYSDSNPAASLRMGALNVIKGQLVYNTSSNSPHFWRAQSTGLGSAVVWDELYLPTKAEILKVRALP